MRQLEYAVAVAKHGRITAAAQEVHVSQPTLSDQLSELEYRLGIKLFERSRRQIVTTEAGQEVVQFAQQILQLTNDLIQVAKKYRGKMVGTVRFAAIPTMAPYLLPKAMTILRPMWPDVDLMLQELQTHDILTQIENGVIDLGMIALPFDTGRLHVEVVAEEPFYLALPQDHDLARETKPLSLEVIRELDMLLLEPGHCLRDHVLVACEEIGNESTREIHGTSLSTLVQMVAGGSGVTLIPEASLEIELRRGNGIIAREFETPMPSRTIALTWRESDPRAQYFEQFTDEFRDVVNFSR